MALGCSAGCSGESTGDPERMNSIIEEGIDNLLSNDFGKAYEILSRARTVVPEDHPEYTEFLYALGLAAWHMSPPSSERLREADDIFSLLSQSDDPRIAAQALIDRGRIAEVSDHGGDQPDLPAARQSYEKAYAKGGAFPDIAYPAALRLAQTHAQEMTTASTQQAVEIAREVIRRYPESDWAPVALEFAGDLHASVLGDTESALDYYSRAYERGFASSSRVDATLWKMAEWAEEIGRPAQAKDYYSAILSDFPRSSFQYLAKERIEALP